MIDNHDRPGCCLDDTNRELPQLLLGIAALGYRGPISERALSSLAAHAKEHGVEAVLSWIEHDPGLVVLPSWQFWPVPLVGLWSRGGP
jgi:hypothetical protein